MGKSKIIGANETTVDVVDTTTGEVLSTVIQTKTVRKSISSKEFMQIYLEDLSGLFRLENKTEIKLMSLIWRDCEFNLENTNIGNRVIALKAQKEQWAKEIGVSLSNVNNTVTNLVKKDLLILESRSIYYLNPEFFFKGFSKDQPAVLRTVLEYKIK